MHMNRIRTYSSVKMGRWILRRHHEQRQPVSHRSYRQVPSEGPSSASWNHNVDKVEMRTCVERRGWYSASLEHPARQRDPARAARFIEVSLLYGTPECEWRDVRPRRCTQSFEIAWSARFNERPPLLRLQPDYATQDSQICDIGTCPRNGL